MKYNLQIITITTFVMVMTLFGKSGLLSAENTASGLLEQTKSVLSADKQTEGGEWIEEHTGQYVPLDLTFTDSQGTAIALSEVIDRPTILLPIYFYCPNICSKNLANLAIAINSLSAVAERDYRVIALSFNDREGSRDAARAKKNYLKIVDDGFPPNAWRFLTGDEASILSVTDAVGFRFKRIDDETYIHPAALIILGADGKIIRYVYGSFLAGDIDMGLADAASGRPSLSVKRLLDFCFNYDPDKNKFTFQFVKIAVLAFFGAVLAFIFVFFKRKRPRTSSGS